MTEDVPLYSHTSIPTFLLTINNDLWVPTPPRSHTVTKDLIIIMVKSVTRMCICDNTYTHTVSCIVYIDEIFMITLLTYRRDYN